MNGNYPETAGEINDAILTACSQQCEEKPNGSGANPGCVDGNWTGLQTAPSWDPQDGFDCVPAEELNKDDPDGSEVPWALVGGPTYPVPLGCALDDDCADWFYPHVRPWVSSPTRGDFIEPETRTAHYLAVETSGSTIALDLDMPGTASGIDDTEALFGLAEYTAIDCGEDVCPFFLANLTAFNTVDSWEVQLQPDIGGKLKKSVSDVQIDLLQSTLGVHHTALDVVAFAPRALRLRVQVTIANNGSGSTYGNGIHALVLENDDYVFAEYDDGALTLAHTFEVQNGEGTLTVAVAPDEHPPTADHDLNATELCDDPEGLALDVSHVLSTDPDNDITIDIWWIDGDPCAGECVLPFGSHQVSIEARDARDAVDRTQDQWVYVTTGCT